MYKTAEALDLMLIETIYGFIQLTSFDIVSFLQLLSPHRFHSTVQLYNLKEEHLTCINLK